MERAWQDPPAIAAAGRRWPPSGVSVRFTAAEAGALRPRAGARHCSVDALAYA